MVDFDIASAAEAKDEAKMDGLPFPCNHAKCPEAFETEGEMVDHFLTCKHQPMPADE